MTTTTYGTSDSFDSVEQQQELVAGDYYKESSCSFADTDDTDDDDDDTINDANVVVDEYCCTWKEYFASWRFVELIVCVLPSLLLFFYFEFIYLIPSFMPRIRPMPFQHVAGSSDASIMGSASNFDVDVNVDVDVNADADADADGGNNGYESYTNIVWNLVNNEKFLGETVSHNEYILMMGICPWLLQLFFAWFLAPMKRNINGIIANNFHRWDAVHRTTCMYFVGIGLTDVITNCVKYYVSDYYL